MDNEMMMAKWKAERERKAFLALADGTVFRGVAFGARTDRCGEVVFNTGMCGYQEILTDPSYAGQFVTLTTAEVGNYGVNPDDVESRGLFLSGLVIGDLTEPSNHRATESLDAYLKRNGVPGIYGVDTRALTRHLRDRGNQKAYLRLEERDGECGASPEQWAIGQARSWEGLDGQDYAARVTCPAPYGFPPPREASAVRSPRPHVVCYDFGVKTNILRSLAAFARVTVVPAKTPVEDVLALAPDGVFLSNGPADPAAVTYAVGNIRTLLERAIPVFGICLGHQLLALACGAKTGRLKFGHHGCNHPVKDLATGRVEITSQNHNFAVLPDSVPACLEVTHVSLNDGSVEGVRHRARPAFSVQYHPESCPGPHDAHHLFAKFRALIGK
ncbi:MAG: glutamine-hydrolyzing carbamoyl-phosphate synthase small subunit [Kiritimatiellia bacterium]